jgi:hypothetical protein
MKTALRSFVEVQYEESHQGDQIRRIFAYWGLFTLGSFLKITELVIHRAFLHCISYVLIWVWVGWVSIWAIFSQTHLVTLKDTTAKSDWQKPKCVHHLINKPDLT